MESWILSAESVLPAPGTFGNNAKQSHLSGFRVLDFNVPDRRMQTRPRFDGMHLVIFVEFVFQNGESQIPPCRRLRHQSWLVPKPENFSCFVKQDEKAENLSWLTKPDGKQERLSGFDKASRGARKTFWLW